MSIYKYNLEMKNFVVVFIIFENIFYIININKNKILFFLLEFVI